MATDKKEFCDSVAEYRSVHERITKLNPGNKLYVFPIIELNEPREDGEPMFIGDGRVLLLAKERFHGHETPVELVLSRKDLKDLIHKLQMIYDKKIDQLLDEVFEQYGDPLEDGDE